MSRNDRLILLVIPLVAAVAVFWFLAVKPKQDKASKLDGQVSQLQTQVAGDQQAAQKGQLARKHFPQDYQRLVVLGKAVPVDDETSSLVIEINRIAERSGVSFRGIDLTQSSVAGASSSAAPTPAPTTTTTSGSSTSSTSTDTSTTSSSTPPASGSTTTPSTTSTTPAAAATTPAAPTESSAAMLPIGATVGSAGLPVMPYTMTFQGSYFQIANFMGGVDDLVKTGKGLVRADGRLATIDAFTMGPGTNTPPGVLVAAMTITTYVSPVSQGLTAGATPTGPAPSPVDQAQSTVQSQNASSAATSTASP
jgi:Tfp pilus assembly protein PilO